MKKIISLLLILTMCITGIAFQGVSVSAANQKGKVNADALNVRSGPGTSYSIITVIYYGTQVTVTGSAKDSSGSKWYKISFTSSGATKTGYVSAEYITITDSGATDTNFETYLKDQGFPDSYKPMLRELHNEHPKWIFKAQKLGIDWSKALDEEMVLGRNLVHLDSLDSWKSMEKGAYNFEGNYWIGLDSYYWVQASEQIVSYYMDPRNFLDDTSIFMFENLSYDSSVHTLDGVKAILSDTFMQNSFKTPDTKKTYSYAQTFMDAAAASGVSPYHLASRCKNEQGVNGAPQSLGTVKGYENYFNFFNIQAYATSTMTAAEMGCKYAKTTDATYMLPWTNQYKSIIGGSIFLGNGYITKGQDTLYLQKFDMVDGGNGYYYHQYMTCVFGQANEAVSLKNAYSTAVLNSALEFKIPVYNNMPSSICPKPTSDGDNNNFLKSLSISGYKLDQTFDKYNMSYTAYVADGADSVKINAAALNSSAKISGAGTVSLTNGSNTVKIKVTAPSGAVRTYTLIITKKPVEAPANVTGFKAASTNASAIKLTWNKVSNADGYIVYRYNTSTKKYGRIAKGGNLAYTDKNLKAGTSYKYAIRSYKTVNGKELLSPSYPEITATTNPANVTGFKAASTNASAIKLTWNKVSSADGYVVYRYNTSTKKYGRIAKGGNLSFTDKNLKAGTTYKYAIRSYKTVNGKEILSPSYPEITATTNPANVTGFKAASTNSSAIKLTWNKVSSADGYVVYRYNTSTKKYGRIAKGGNLAFTDKNLKAGTTYKYAIRSYKTVNGKEILSPSYPEITATTNPANVTGFKAASTNASAIKLTWNKVSSADGYVVYRYNTSTKKYGRIAKGKNLAYTDKNLKAGTSYKYAIRSYKTVNGKELLSPSYPEITAKV